MHRFRSRVSVLLVALVVASVLPAFFLGEPNTNAYLAYAILGTAVGFVLVTLFSMKYIITEEHISVKTGPFSHGRILISEIESIERSYNPLSSPSASLKRLYIKGKDRDTLISPTNEKEFVRILKSRNPEILVKIDDNDLWWQFWMGHLTIPPPMLIR